VPAIEDWERVEAPVVLSTQNQNVVEAQAKRHWTAGGATRKKKTMAERSRNSAGCRIKPGKDFPNCTAGVWDEEKKADRGEKKGRVGPTACKLQPTFPVEVVIKGEGKLPECRTQTHLWGG